MAAKAYISWSEAIDRRHFLGLGAGLTSAFWATSPAAAPASGLVEAVRREAFAEIKGARRALTLRFTITGGLRTKGIS